MKHGWRRQIIAPRSWQSNLLFRNATSAISSSRAQRPVTVKAGVSREGLAHDFRGGHGFCLSRCEFASCLLNRGGDAFIMVVLFCWERKWRAEKPVFSKSHYFTPQVCVIFPAKIRSHLILLAQNLWDKPHVNPLKWNYNYATVMLNDSGPRKMSYCGIFVLMFW